MVRIDLGIRNGGTKKNYKCTLSDRQAMAHFDKEKPTHRGYTEHLNYLLQVNSAGGGHFDRNVLKSMVHRSGADLIHEISSKYDRNRTDYINHATELAEFADELWNERNLDKNTARPNRGGSNVNAVVTKRPEMRDCYNCGRKGHLSKDCTAPQKRSFNFGKKEKKTDKKAILLPQNGPISIIKTKKNTSVRAGTAFSPCPNASVYLLTIFLQLLEFLLRI